MKVAASADWRQSIPFETPMLVADLVPGEPTRCFTCGMSSEPRERTELWAFKHRHPRHHDGFVRFYCQPHVPVVTRPEPVAAPARARAASRPERTSAPRRTPAADPKPRAMCPSCFVEVSAKGECGMCGASVV
ncbi:glucose-6-phosphate dehydrogenase [Microbacterium sp. NPDC055910]|uniref:glucose-6-phosphate dehydrogenase n=1 Tax=Microbacterium sp. NPDC055910 TaxID=3345659 RepID=UPI0035D6CB92